MKYNKTHKFFLHTLYFSRFILRDRRGATIAELLLSLAIMVIVAGFGMISLLSRQSPAQLDATTRQMVGLLGEARSRAIAQVSSTAWGVHFENSTSTAPFYALFSSSTYSTSSRENYYRLPGSVIYNTSTLAAGATKDVIFSQITGGTTSTTLALKIVAGSSQSSTITIASSGLVSY